MHKNMLKFFLYLHLALPYTQAGVDKKFGVYVYVYHTDYSLLKYQTLALYHWIKSNLPS